jgi:hypothetical protein
LGLFSPRGSQWKSVPPIIFGTGLACIVNFHSIEAKVEEAGILLTAYLRSSSSLYSGTRRHVEAQIRERQCLLRALEQVSQAVHDAVDNGRLKLKSMPEEQCKSQEEGDPYDE